ncbi:transcription initiation factor TFIID subunit 3 isoform X2 [Thrips palmi]|uniref:Transcription initiation factor TFIID subunit 3 isoform X2 n=1 Tax=Thrips palmi TaxID=161013 RepID=A0A6P8XVA3_THRPL|nr:transcription initiation factor TFIID subunit 3 isoform X2 [Thrips palmi]
MAQEFNRKALTLVVAQICQTIGWHSINSTPLELLVDLLHRYLFEVGKNAHLYAEQLGHTTPDLDDLGLAFQEMGVSVEDLKEYVQYVDSVPFIHQVPKFPVPRESHLNFLKPGSREVVTRPVHVHEYLPPMYPDLENEAAEEYPNKNSPLSVDISSPGPSSGPNSAGGSLSPQSSPKPNPLNPFKRPGEPITAESPALKRARVLMEEEGRPLREISSVMMTTSGFLSPAREGKLPEARTPLQPSDSRSNSPQPSHYPSVPPEVNKSDKKLKKLLPKKPTDITKKMDKENKKKDHSREAEPQGESNMDESNVAKLVSMKETSKLKAFKPAGFKHQQPQPGSSSSAGAYKIPKVSANKSPKRPKQAHAPHNLGPPASPPMSDYDDKISSAPDRQKLSFFKKISKVKEEKPERTDKNERINESPIPMKETKNISGGWVVNEEKARKEVRSSQIDSCIESVIQQGIQDCENIKRERDVSVSSDSFVDVGGTSMAADSSPLHTYPFEFDASPPHSPAAPKTPEIVHTLLAKEESKKKKEKSKLKKEMRAKSKELSPKKLKMEPNEDDYVERPKTPEVKLDFKPYQYVSVPPHPGLIPPLLDNKRPENLALIHSPPRDCLSPEKPVTPGAGVLGTSLSHQMQTPTTMHSFFHNSPASSSTTTPTGVPVTPGAGILPLTPGYNLPSVSPLIKKKGLDGKGKNLEKTYANSGGQDSDVGQGGMQCHQVSKQRGLVLVLKKEHKKDKKDKKDKNKIKKKKDKKDKNKDKSLKKKDKVLKKLKDKNDLKGLDKVKDKIKDKKKDKKKKEEPPPLLVTEEMGVPKLTLRIGSDSPRPATPEAALPTAPLTAPKIVIKPVKKPVSEEERMLKAGLMPEPPLFSSSHVIESERYRREKELKREREKEQEREKEKLEKERLERERELERDRQREVERERELERERERERDEREREREKERARLAALDQTSRTPVCAVKPSKQKSSKTHKHPFSDLSSFTSASSPFPTLSASQNQLDTPKVKKSSSKKDKSLKKLERTVSPSPDINPVRTVAPTPVAVGGPATPLTSEQITSGIIFDAMGNKVWICPSCKCPDDGRPMIGCDDCDAWYHWVCVNITIAPDENENWYCRFCTMKKSENLDKKKKKKSKKKPKVPV